MTQAKVEKPTDIADFSKMDEKEIDEFTKNILQRQIDLAETFAKFACSVNNGKDIFNVQKDIITEFVENLNIEKFKQRLVEKKNWGKNYSINLFVLIYLCIYIVVNFIF